MESIPPVDSQKFLVDQVNRIIKNYESGHVQVQVVTSEVPGSAHQHWHENRLRGVRHPPGLEAFALFSSFCSQFGLKVFLNHQRIFIF